MTRIARTEKTVPSSLLCSAAILIYYSVVGDVVECGDGSVLGVEFAATFKPPGE